ncbi:hypothetical protein F1737_10310 [Methanoplanus sp. FWC-SCC4]|uniref:Uncharacterized protein n=1 Tax=Methanochimaera problematica TaxID=2609417 RepID=A0AA97FEG1_9EURY|nr:hypothetical protein [Methanoplanus sp. FWC-SCC4]WOF17042.1 hypothetical protein F1737_10310 [Methanoplanus sp. FWC-SCC4]
MSANRDLENKRRALAGYLGVGPDKITDSKGTIYSFKAFYHGPNRAYLVLNEIEANVAARRAIKSRLWLIALESIYSYFDIDSYPADALDKIPHDQIRKINAEIVTLVEKSCGTEILAEKMLKLGNRSNILADYDQKEIRFEDYYIYRLF